MGRGYQSQVACVVCNKSQCLDSVGKGDRITVDSRED